MLTPFFLWFLFLPLCKENGKNMTQRTFRIISLVVVASLVMVAAMQCVWVARLYNDKKADFLRRVQSATYKSVYKSFRMDAIPGLQPADMVKIDLDDFVFWLEPSMLELNALQPYAVEVVSNVLDGKVMMSRGDKTALRNMRSVEVDIDDGKMFTLHLYISVPYSDFWLQMWGLILSSLMIVVLLAGVFIYLIKTMFRQKTLEEMRRDLTHNITHELKTPISVAYAANDALRNFSAVDNPERRSRYLEIVASQLTRLSTMVERILAVSVEEGDVVRHNPSQIELRPLIEQIGGDCSAAGKRVEFSFECEEDVMLYADRFHLKNILSTIVDNSIKYSDTEVTIAVDVKCSDGWVTISVTDNGRGIAPRHLEHIFDKFYRIPSGDRHDVRGYGLGLYYARCVVERHKGEISAFSREGEGTTITIKLPQNEK